MNCVLIADWLFENKSYKNSQFSLGNPHCCFSMQSLNSRLAAMALAPYYIASDQIRFSIPFWKYTEAKTLEVRSRCLFAVGQDVDNALFQDDPIILRLGSLVYLKEAIELARSEQEKCPCKPYIVERRKNFHDRVDFVYTGNGKYQLRDVLYTIDQSRSFVPYADDADYDKDSDDDDYDDDGTKPECIHVTTTTTLVRENPANRHVQCSGAGGSEKKEKEDDEEEDYDDCGCSLFIMPHQEFVVKEKIVIGDIDAFYSTVCKMIDELLLLLK